MGLSHEHQEAQKWLSYSYLKASVGAENTNNTPATSDPEGNEEPINEILHN